MPFNTSYALVAMNAFVFPSMINQLIDELDIHQHPLDPYANLS